MSGEIVPLVKCLPCKHRPKFVPQRPCKSQALGVISELGRWRENSQSPIDQPANLIIGEPHFLVKDLVPQE